MPRLLNILKEHIFPGDTTPSSSFDFERWGNLMIRAYFNSEGGWGRPPKSFILYITPSGIIRGIQGNAHISLSDHPFKEGQEVDLSDLIQFEREGKFNLRMKGRIREGRLNEEESPDLHDSIIHYMETMRPHDELLDAYIKLRHYFKNAGYSEEDIRSVKRAPGWVWEIQNRIPSLVGKIKHDLKKLGLINPESSYTYMGGDMGEKIFMDYLKGEMSMIDKEYPLNSPETSYVPPVMKNPDHSI